MATGDRVMYEAVEQVANESRGAGTALSVGLIQAKLGGNNTTILRHFDR